VSVVPYDHSAHPIGLDGEEMMTGTPHRASSKSVSAFTQATGSSRYFYLSVLLIVDFNYDILPRANRMGISLMSDKGDSAAHPYTISILYDTIHPYPTFQYVRLLKRCCDFAPSQPVGNTLRAVTMWTDCPLICFFQLRADPEPPPPPPFPENHA
jgi:hypothetical protein